MKQRTTSLIYLMVGSISIFGHLNMFEKWCSELLFLSFGSVIFYLMTLTLLTFVHPTICLYKWRKRAVRNGYTKTIKVHFVWSMVIVASFWVMIFSGYMITV